MLVLSQDKTIFWNLDQVQTVSVLGRRICIYDNAPGAGDVGIFTAAEYKTPERTKEVLLELFNAYSSGNYSKYRLPIE